MMDLDPNAMILVWVGLGGFVGWLVGRCHPWEP